MARDNSKLKKAQRKSISPVLSSLSKADRDAQKKTRRDLVAKAKAKRAKPKSKPKAKPKAKRRPTRTVGGFADLLKSRGRL